MRCAILAFGMPEERESAYENLQLVAMAIRNVCERRKVLSPMATEADVLAVLVPDYEEGRSKELAVPRGRAGTFLVELPDGLPRGATVTSAIGNGQESYLVDIESGQIALEDIVTAFEAFLDQAPAALPTNKLLILIELLQYELSIALESREGLLEQFFALEKQSNDDKTALALANARVEQLEAQLHALQSARHLEARPSLIRRAAGAAASAIMVASSVAGAAGSWAAAVPALEAPPAVQAQAQSVPPALQASFASAHQVEAFCEAWDPQK